MPCRNGRRLRKARAPTKRALRQLRRLASVHPHFGLLVQPPATPAEPLLECEYDFRMTSGLSTAYILSILPAHISRLACERPQVATAGSGPQSLYDEVKHDASSA